MLPEQVLLQTGKKLVEFLIAVISVGIIMLRTCQADNLDTYEACEVVELIDIYSSGLASAIVVSGMSNGMFAGLRRTRITLYDALVTGCPSTRPVLYFRGGSDSLRLISGKEVHGNDVHQQAKVAHDCTVWEARLQRNAHHPSSGLSGASNRKQY